MLLIFENSCSNFLIDISSKNENCQRLIATDEESFIPMDPDSSHLTLDVSESLEFPSPDLPPLKGSQSHCKKTSCDDFVEDITPLTEDSDDYPCQEVSAGES